MTADTDDTATVLLADRGFDAAPDQGASSDAPLRADIPAPTPSAIPDRSPAPASSPLVITVCMAMLFALGYGGGFLWLKAQKRTDPQATEPAATGNIAAAPVPAANPLPAAPKPENATPAAASARIVTETEAGTPSRTIPARPIAVTRAAPAIAPRAAPTTPQAAGDAMSGKVAMLLSRADGYLDNHQYDKAIATAESALELEPGSTAASAMVKKAQTRQLEALRNDSSLN
jgi:hypothetical protein